MAWAPPFGAYCSLSKIWFRLSLILWNLWGWYWSLVKWNGDLLKLYTFAQPIQKFQRSSFSTIITDLKLKTEEIDFLNYTHTSLCVLDRGQRTFSQSENTQNESKYPIQIQKKPKDRFQSKNWNWNYSKLKKMFYYTFFVLDSINIGKNCQFFVEQQNPHLSVTLNGMSWDLQNHGRERNKIFVFNHFCWNTNGN